MTDSYSKMKAVILSAGLGTRLRPLTNSIPKAMIPIGNKPLLEHQINLVKRHGITEIIINLHHMPEKIKKYFGDGSKFGVEIVYSNEPKILGTAGGVKKVEKLLSDPFLVMFADNLTNMNLSSVMDFHKSHDALGTISLYNSRSPETMGVVVSDENKNIIKFLEKDPNPPTNEVSSGICVFDRAILEYVPKGVEYDFGSQLYPDLLSKGIKLKCINPNSYVQDTGTIERYNKAQRDFERGVLESSN